MKGKIIVTYYVKSMNGENLINILELCEKSELNYFKYCMNGEELAFQKGIISENGTVKYEYQSVAAKESFNGERVIKESLGRDNSIQENIDIIDLNKKSGDIAEPKCVIVKSNFVGAFSLSESLKEGKKTVKKGSVLAVIEAMKVYNDILAPVDGIVEEILVADGSLVECDQELISIRVSG